MTKSLKSYLPPVTRFDIIKVEKYGKKVPVRIMLMVYDDNVEVYYQEEGYPFEFGYGVPATNRSIKRIMAEAMNNVVIFGLHYGE